MPHGKLRNYTKPNLAKHATVATPLSPNILSGQSGSTDCNCKRTAVTAEASEDIVLALLPTQQLDQKASAVCVEEMLCDPSPEERPQPLHVDDDVERGARFPVEVPATACAIQGCSGTYRLQPVYPATPLPRHESPSKQGLEIGHQLS